MEDPFKIGLKGFFGVATGFGLLVLTINVIQVINSSINNVLENQEQKRIEELNVKKVIQERLNWADKRIKGCLKYPTKKQRDYCINVYTPYLR